MPESRSVGCTQRFDALQWRLTQNLDDHAAAPVTTDSTGVTFSGIKLELPRGVLMCELHFAGGRVETVEKTRAKSGLWIVQDSTRGAAAGELCTVACGAFRGGWPLQNRTNGGGDGM